MSMGEDSRGNDVSFSARLPSQIIDQIDAEARRLERETGLEVTRSEVTRKILREYFAASEAPAA